MKGFFITFEGIEGSGKSTQARLFYEYCRSCGADAVLTVEPGGTEIGREIRRILLDPANNGMHPITELLLYNASRCQLIKEVIGPSILAGRTVISDRFSDSTIAYQGYGRNIPLSTIAAIDQAATVGLKPDVTILLDVPAEVGLERNRKANKRDRLELEDIEFHKRVRQGFLKLNEAEPGRIKLISTDGRTVDEVHEEIVRLIGEKCRR